MSAFKSINEAMQKVQENPDPGAPTGITVNSASEAQAAFNAVQEWIAREVEAQGFEDLQEFCEAQDIDMNGNEFDDIDDVISVLGQSNIK